MIRRILTAAVAAGSVALAAGLAVTGCGQNLQTQQAAAVDTLALGEKISYTSGCQDCHTPGTFYGAPDYSRQLTGSELGWMGPWGISYPRNLTPDMETGLGSWTEEQIAIAIRTGMRPDGSQLLPPMPWPMYSHLTEFEALAVAKFLKSLPPTSHKVPDVVPPGVEPPADACYMVFPPPRPWDAPVEMAGAAGGH